MSVHHPLLATRRPRRFLPSVWDAAIFILVIGGLTLVALGGREALQPLAQASRTPVSLDPAMLPHYALRTTLRMLAGLICSLIFTLVYGAWAAKSRRAEVVLVPILDVLQSIPILSFMSFTLTFFLALAPGKVLGAECASVFLVFTSQAWNMAFSFYQSLKTVPRDLSDVSDSLRLGAWRRFWTLEAPFAAPGLIWNAMMSMSGAWFMVVASEVFSVGQTNITLPGIGAYVSLAIQRQDLRAIGWAIVAMLVVIVLYDQLLFRPLVAWSEKFRVELSPGQEPPGQSWLLDFVQRARLARAMSYPLRLLLQRLARLRFRAGPITPRPVTEALQSRWADWAWFALVALIAAYAAWRIVAFVGAGVGPSELPKVLGYGALTLLRVLVLIALASLIWVPIGIWVGLRPRWAARVQPAAQFLAAFPSNLLFPLVVLAIVRFNLLPDVWLSPLMILGTQWYILFNVIAGASALPQDLREAAASFGVRGWSWWRKVALPGVFPYYVTGAITASGGAWNASLVAEVASWGKTTVQAHGLGAYINEQTARGDFHRIVLGVAVMSLYVVLFNRLLWRPLFAFASRRLRLD